METHEKAVYQLHADVCKTLSHPRRLEIIDKLRVGEISAGELAKMMDLSKANLSQHLGILRSQGIVEVRRNGVHLFYRIANPKVVQACQLIREVLLARLESNQELIQTVREIEV